MARGGRRQNEPRVPRPLRLLQGAGADARANVGPPLSAHFAMSGLREDPARNPDFTLHFPNAPSAAFQLT